MATRVKKIRLEQDVQDTLDVIDTTGTGSKFLNDAGSYEEVSGQAVSQIAYDTIGDADDYEVIIPNVTYLDNTIFIVRFHITNLANATLNVNGLGPIMMSDLNGNNLMANVLNVNNTYIVRYEGSDNKMYIAEMMNVGSINNYQSNFLDLQPIEASRVDFALPGMNDTNSMIYDGIKYLYISNGNGNAIHKFDISTNTQIATVGTGAKPMHGLSIIGGFLYVPCSTGNRVDKIDLSTFTNVGNVATGAGPIAVVGGGDGFLYVACSTGNRVDKIDLSTFTNVGNISLTSPGYERIIVVNGFLYVCSYSQNKVHKIDLSTFTNFGNVATGAGPYSVVLGGDGFLYVACNTGNRVDKIDLSTFTNVGNVATGAGPFGMDVRNNFLYVACILDNTIYTIDTATFTVIGVPLITANGPETPVIIGSYLYTSNQVDNNLTRLGLNTLTAPSTGMFRLYFKTNGKLYRMDDTGAEQLIGTQT